MLFDKRGKPKLLHQEKSLGARMRTKNELNPSIEIKHRPYWLEVSALTNVPSQLDRPYYVEYMYEHTWISLSK